MPSTEWKLRFAKRLHAVLNRPHLDAEIDHLTRYSTFPYLITQWMSFDSRPIADPRGITRQHPPFSTKAAGIVQYKSLTGESIQPRRSTISPQGVYLASYRLTDPLALLSCRVSHAPQRPHQRIFTNTALPRCDATERESRDPARRNSSQQNQFPCWYERRQSRIRR
jgi:hypothetical protein